METKEILRSIREKNNLTQEQFAERINVTRQAVSRWDNGETQPNTEQPIHFLAATIVLKAGLQKLMVL